ncbi:MAG: hypothetical protein IKS28_08825, partial [Clostridia bacterium]|nr:hypothetical protein [Clostridia bacterium]
MKRIFAVLVVLAMVLGVALVANAEDVEFCGTNVSTKGAVTFDGKTATFKGDVDGFFFLNDVGTGDFSFEFDYTITTNPSDNPFRIEIKGADWFQLSIPAGSHAVFEGSTETGNYKFTVDGNVVAEGQSDALKCTEW